MARRFKRITITIPERLLARLDEFCKERGYTRAELIRAAIRHYIQKERAE